ncbi:MAG TPA: DMT family transporter [Stellaceae bacterium]|nr:DMT family transporter [Stellaceae bacterium]
MAWCYLAIMVVSWAANWPLMKLALGDIHPLPFVLVRLLGTLALLAPYLLLRGAPLVPLRGERLGLFWVGQLQVAGYLICAIIGLSIVPPGRAVVLAYTMPLWAIPIGLWLWPEPLGRFQLGRFQLAGAVVGFAGLVLFMNPRLVDWGDWHVLAGNGLLLLAAICWALGSCLYRRRSWGTPFWAQTFWQLAVSTVAIIVIALPATLAEPVHWSPALIAILLYNSVVTTALGYFLWSKVLTMMSATVAGQVLAVTPVGGFLLSIAMFGGSVGGEVVLSIGLIIAGIVLTLRP